MLTMRKVLVLNTTDEPLNVCSVRRALVLLLKDKAEILERTGSALHSERSAYEIPLVIRLTATCASRTAPRRRVSRAGRSSRATSTAASTAAARGT